MLAARLSVAGAALSRLTGTLHISRALTTSEIARMDAPREVRIPVPWGHIAGKMWGDPAGKAVLAVHGWQDNAGSFDKLIPFLSKDLQILAVDLPGHGLSSHRPPGAFYHVYDYIADLKYVVDAMKWDTFSFLAHSMGTGIATWFAGALSDRVEAMVLLEGFGFWSQPMSTIPQCMAMALNSFTMFEEKDTKTYPTIDSAIDRMLEGHFGDDKEFDRAAASALVIRGTKKNESGEFQFSRDLRLKANSLLRVADELNLVFMKAVKCPTIIVMGEATFIPSVVINDNLVSVDREKVKIVKVAGGHHLHLYRPETISVLVDSFLRTHTIPPSFPQISRL